MKKIVKYCCYTLLAFRCLLDRCYNLKFNRGKCIKMLMEYDYYEYNDIVVNGEGKRYRYLGKSWYKQNES